MGTAEGEAKHFEMLVHDGAVAGWSAPVSQVLCWGLGVQERTRPPPHPKHLPSRVFPNAKREVCRQCHYSMTTGVGGLAVTPSSVLVALVAGE